MPGPKPTPIVLTAEERTELERLVRARTTSQQLAMRARIVCLAGDGLSTAEVGRRLHVHIDTAREWRSRWQATAGSPLAERSVAERLADAPKSGRPARITPEQLCQIIALACEIPAASDRPVSQWSARELADEIVKRGILERISPRHVGRLLKSGRPPAPPDPLLAHPSRRPRRRGAGGAHH
jgi:putative transposase